MTLPIIAFDEAGNTGQNLLDPAQPVFTLASVLLSPEEARAVLAPSNARGDEAHFARLRRSAPGRQALVAILNHHLICDALVKVSIIHKPFMVVTKIVDMLIETLAHRYGHNLYERGGNIATANLLYMVLPVFCGQEPTKAMYNAFIAMIRDVSRESASAYYASVDLLIEVCVNDSFRETLKMLRATETVLDEGLGTNDTTAIDPAIPAFVLLASEWTGELRREFVILHDASKPIAKDRDLLMLLMSIEEPLAEVGYDRRKGMFPIRAQDILFGNSVAHPELQVADIVASSMAYIHNKRATGGLDEFAKALAHTRLSELTVDPVWPTDKITPAELGTEETGGSDPIEYFQSLAARIRAKRRNS